MKLFAHTKWDAAPVLAAVAHLLFNIYLIVGFSSRPLWLSAALGCALRGVHIVEHQQHLAQFHPHALLHGAVAQSRLQPA